MNQEETSSMVDFIWRVSACHMISYFLMGFLFFNLFNYKEAYVSTILSSLMLPTDSPWVAAGPALQIIRGILFSLVLWPIRNIILLNERGWLILWILFLGLTVFGTAGPAPGSLEGIFYTKIPIKYHLFGLPEVILQTLLFSTGLFYWYRYPKRAWNIMASVILILIVLMSLAGVFLR